MVAAFLVAALRAGFLAAVFLLTDVFLLAIALDLFWDLSPLRILPPFWMTNASPSSFMH